MIVVEKVVHSPVVHRAEQAAAIAKTLVWDYAIVRGGGRLLDEVLYRAAYGTTHLYDRFGRSHRLVTERAIPVPVAADTPIVHSSVVEPDSTSSRQVYRAVTPPVEVVEQKTVDDEERRRLTEIQAENIKAEEEERVRMAEIEAEKARRTETVVVADTRRRISGAGWIPVVTGVSLVALLAAGACFITQYRPEQSATTQLATPTALIAQPTPTAAIFTPAAVAAPVTASFPSLAENNVQVVNVPPSEVTTFLPRFSEVQENSRFSAPLVEDPVSVPVDQVPALIDSRREYLPTRDAEVARITRNNLNDVVSSSAGKAEALMFRDYYGRWMNLDNVDQRARDYTDFIKMMSDKPEVRIRQRAELQRIIELRTQWYNTAAGVNREMFSPGILPHFVHKNCNHGMSEAEIVASGCKLAAVVIPGVEETSRIMSRIAA